MLAYNGSIPGPTLHVDQGSEITVDVTNEGDVAATVHWHGLRLENRYDGVPHDTQAPIEIGETFTYKVQFPDAGFYWYHPHIREDFGLEMGLYGTIIVEPTDASYWPEVDRQLMHHAWTICSSRMDTSQRSTRPVRTSRRWVVSETSC